MASSDLLNVGAPIPGNTEAIIRAFKASVPGSVIGAGIGLLRAGLSGKGNYLNQSLAGALLGGGAAGGLTYMSEAGPFVRGGRGGKALEAGGATLAADLLAGSPLRNAASRGMMTGTYSLLSGRGRFSPQEQEALVQQFLQSTLPTTGGWQKRIGLARKVVNQLGEERPQYAFRRLKALGKVAPDASMRALVGDTISRLKSGGFRGPEQRQALGALAQGLSQRADFYEKVMPTLKAMHELKRRYAGKEIDRTELAKRFGIVTGRFGRTGDEAKQLRSFIREMIARPVSSKPTTSIERASMAYPDIGRLLESAVNR